ncbi:hypothetical protein Glove_114g104 [Diversispora epigaea]|uniref:AAA-ATPase-like domain-containing protein n=1 Tax=Diversispora epigaea TaxID=1348612 RepID=A0A397J1U0_9GLOM|nr:hypothetical protein Glove_114g105 [Diversispora epigaea]RHZ82142.1 hypothetical protein Glove_114g104 [Diversispora epigaea]
MQSRIDDKKDDLLALSPSSSTCIPAKRGFAVDSILDFKDLKLRNLFYIDKTKHIKNIEHSRFVLIFLRPNRFGKSLLLSTLKYFYDINEAEYFQSLFESLEIYQFASGLKPNNSSDFRETNKCFENHINTSIVDFCYKHAYMLKKNFEDLKQLVVYWNNCITSFENLLCTFRECEYKLLDKLSLYKAIFATFKAHCGKEIKRVFIIGVSPVLINNISSLFDISYDITLEQDFKYMCGLEEKDIKEALTYIFTEKEHYTDKEKQNFIKFHLVQICIIYNKYKYKHTQNSGIYCTNVCLNYLQNLLDGKQIGNSNELDDNMLRFSKLKEWIKKGNLYDDRELVTKCKGIDFLDLKINGCNRNWNVMESRVNKVEAMSECDLRQLKCGNGEQFDKGKTMEQILNDGCEQLLVYVHNLNEQDIRNHCEFVTSAFVVLTVGLRKLL